MTTFFLFISYSIEVLLIHLLKIEDFKKKICTMYIENGEFIGFSKLTRSN